MDQNDLLEVKPDADAVAVVHENENAYLNQLLAESKQLDPSLILCHKLLNQGKIILSTNRLSAVGENFWLPSKLWVTLPW